MAISLALPDAGDPDAPDAPDADAGAGVAGFGRCHARFGDPGGCPLAKEVERPSGLAASAATLSAASTPCAPSAASTATACTAPCAPLASATSAAW